MIIRSLFISTGNFNFIILKNKLKSNIYIYNKVLYILLTVTGDLFISTNTNSIDFNMLQTNIKQKCITKYWRFFLKSWSTFFFNKITFKGKGYKIRKKKKPVKFFLGCSHLTNIWFRGVIVRRLHKYKLIVLSPNTYKLYLIKKFIDRIRKLNIFTKRGLRFKCQKVMKKAGKKSSYM